MTATICTRPDPLCRKHNLSPPGSTALGLPMALAWALGCTGLGYTGLGYTVDPAFRAARYSRDVRKHTGRGQDDAASAAARKDLIAAVATAHHGRIAGELPGYSVFWVDATSTMDKYSRVLSENLAIHWRATRSPPRLHPCFDLSFESGDPWSMVNGPGR